MIEINSCSRDMSITAIESSSDDKIEKEILRKCKKELSYKELEKSSTLKNYISTLSREVLGKIENRNLVKSKEQTSKEYLSRFGMSIVLFIPGISKMVLGISRGKPVLFLLILLLLFQVIFYIVNTIKDTADVFDVFLQEEKRKYRRPNAINMDDDYYEMMFSVVGSSSLKQCPETIGYATAIESIDYRDYSPTVSKSSTSTSSHKSSSNDTSTYDSSSHQTSSSHHASCSSSSSCGHSSGCGHGCGHGCGGCGGH